MKLDQFLKVVSGIPLDSKDSNIMVLVSSESEDYFNVLTNMDVATITKHLYGLYRTSDVFRDAINAIRVQISSDLEPRSVSDTVQDAMKDLGAIFVSPNKFSS